MFSSQYLVGATMAALSTSGNFTRAFSAIHTGRWNKQTNMPDYAPMGMHCTERTEECDQAGQI